MKEYEKPQMEIIELSGAGVFTDQIIGSQGEGVGDDWGD